MNVNPMDTVVSVQCNHCYEPIDGKTLQHASHNHTIAPPLLAQETNLGLVGVLIHLLGDAVNSSFPCIASNRIETEVLNT